MKFFDRLFRRKTRRIEVVRGDNIQLFFILDAPVKAPIRIPLQDDELQRVEIQSDWSGSLVTAQFSLTNEAVGELIVDARYVECVWRGETFNESRIISRSWDRASGTMTVRASNQEGDIR